VAEAIYAHFHANTKGSPDADPVLRVLQ
jgi:hypothetical protein